MRSESANSSLRDKIIGLGERSVRKSYYPELRQQLAEAEKSRSQLAEKSAALLNMLEDLEKTRSSLAESEARFRSLVENINDVIFSVDLKGAVTYISPVIQNISGLKPEEIIGRHLKELVHPEDQAALVEHHQLEVAGQVAPREFRLQDKQGGFRHVRVSCRPLVAAGQVAGLTGVMSDITERKRAEEALRLAGVYNRSLIEASLDPLVTIGADGKITDVNAATEAATGRTRAELVGTDFCDYFSDPARARAGFQQAFREGLVKNYALELRHRDGHLTSVLYNASVYRDESGGVLGVFAAARDITERKRTEEALRESQALYHSLVEQLPAGVFRKNAAGRYDYVNPWFCRLKGLKAEVFLNKTPDEVGAIELAAKVPNMAQVNQLVAQGTDQHRQIMETGRSVEIEEHGYDADGKELYLSVLKTPIFDLNGKIVGSQGIMFDITGRKQAEEEVRKLNAELEERVQQRTRELAASEQRFRTIYDTAPVAIWQEDWTKVVALVDALRSSATPDFAAYFRDHPEFVTRALNAVKILDANQWTLNMFKAKDRAEMLASLATVFATPDTLPGFVGELVALAQGNLIYRTEMALNTVQGGQIQTLLAMSFPPSGADFDKVLVTVIDITERKQSERLLQKSEERMRLFFERQLVGMAFTSLEKGWLKVNDKICEMLGYSREELARMTWAELTCPEDLPADLAQYERLLKGEIEGYVLEKRFVRKGGGMVFTNLAVGCVRKPDRSVDYVLVLLEDITDRKHAEANIQRLNGELQQRAREFEAANQELQRMNKLFIGRELRMVELKVKLRALEKTGANAELNQTKDQP
jgi:PAS domain S-box-containing protein